MSKETRPKALVQFKQKLEDKYGAKNVQEDKQGSKYDFKVIDSKKEMFFKLKATKIDPSASFNGFPIASIIKAIENADSYFIVYAITKDDESFKFYQTTIGNLLSYFTNLYVQVKQILKLNLTTMVKYNFIIQEKELPNPI